VTHERLARIEAQLREALAPRPLGEDPTQKKLPPELIEKAKLLLERGDKEQQALAEIALQRHLEADKLIQELKQEPLAEAFRLLTLEGTNWYHAGTFDKAIPPFEQALALQPDNTDARNWAAVAHGQARLGDITAHQQRAIALLTDNLALLPEHSWNWAMAQNNLGEAWREMPTGDKTENLGKAIAAFTAALEVYTRQAHPVGWAMTQNNLGNAWREMPMGDKTENLGKAIAAFTAALEVRIRRAYPVDWAMTQNNLGAAWAQMPTGDKAENLGKAIAAYTAALEVRTRQAHPVDWAMTQNNLGTAWVEMPTGDRTENLSKAIAAHSAALEVYTRQAHPMNWAMTQNNLGIAWRNMPTGNKAENLGKAIDAYTAALEVRTRRAYPVDWAMTHFNLGLAFAGRAELGGGCADGRKAIAEVKAAAEVWTAAAFPFYHQNHIAPALDQLRKAWQAHGCGVGFDAIPPTLTLLRPIASPRHGRFPARHSRLRRFAASGGGPRWRFSGHGVGGRALCPPLRGKLLGGSVANGHYLGSAFF
jgi:tetratricopeptide (TPR) repeat protein